MSMIEKSGIRLFNVGNDYTRKEIFEILEIPESSRTGGIWFTGYASYCGEFYLFVNVMTAGRTGHNYEDRWLDERTLLWHGKTNSHINQPTIQKMLQRDSIVHVFTRDDSADVKFRYQGMAKPLHVRDTSPVEIDWIL